MPKMEVTAFLLLLLQTLCGAAAQLPPPTSETALSRMGIADDDVSLRQALHDRRPGARSQAAAELAMRKDVGAIPDIEASLDKEHVPQVAYSMALSLHELGVHEADRYLLGYCMNHNTANDIRFGAANTLSRSGDYRCAPALGELLHSPDAGLRQATLLYLHAIPTYPKGFSSLGPDLLAAADDSDSYIQNLAGQIILNIGDKRTKETYQKEHKQ